MGVPLNGAIRDSLTLFIFVFNFNFFVRCSKTECCEEYLNKRDEKQDVGKTTQAEHEVAVHNSRYMKK
jgi:hypothetical protein